MINRTNLRKQRKENKGITLIVLVITIIILLILAGISIATLTGKNGILDKTSKAKEENLIEQYKEEINLIIIDEIAERKIQNKEELMILSLDSKIREKKWVNEIYKCNSSGEEQPTFDASTHLLVESKEHYEFLIEVNEAKQIAKIVSLQKGTEEKYTITYHPNGGEGEEEIVEIRQGFSVTLKECNYTRDQYKFVGWCENQDGEGERYLENSTYKPEGQVILYAIWKAPSTVEEAKEAGTVLNQNMPTIIKDTYGNEVKVPEGFKIAEDSANDVTGGVVIEDVSHGITAGSQFVWIPVGTVYTNTQRTESKTIILNRYTFDESGNSTVQEENVIDSYHQEIIDSERGNTIAKDINAFKTSTIINKGYYIGRYEARSIAQRSSSSDTLEQVTVKANDYVCNFVTQPQAATLARGMYGVNKNFTSDLVNSYAWDTAIVFLQTFDNREDKTKPYSRQSSLNTGSLPAEKGTNHLSGSEKQDKICNIWDMASNTSEWTTETSNYPSAPSVDRGGNYAYDDYTSIRNRHPIDDSYDILTFRCILYL